MHCYNGQVLETEGEIAKFAYIVVKGKLRIYKKIHNDELRDDNKRRREKRGLTVGQKIEVPAPANKTIVTTMNTTKSDMGGMNITGPIQGVSGMNPSNSAEKLNQTDNDILNNANFNPDNINHAEPHAVNERPSRLKTYQGI